MFRASPQPKQRENPEYFCNFIRQHLGASGCLRSIRRIEAADHDLEGVLIHCFGAARSYCSEIHDEMPQAV
jgi:hypothetical protein